MIAKKGKFFDFVLFPISRIKLCVRFFDSFSWDPFWRWYTFKLFIRMDWIDEKRVGSSGQKDRPRSTASIKCILTINLIISTISINYQKQNAITSPFYTLSIRAWNYTLLSNEAYDVCGCLEWFYEWFYPSTIWTRNNHTPFPLLFPLLLSFLKTLENIHHSS